MIKWGELDSGYMASLAGYRWTIIVGKDTPGFYHCMVLGINIALGILRLYINTQMLHKSYT